MPWDPDAIASAAPQTPTPTSATAEWDPDAHIDAAGKNVYGSFWGGVKNDAKFIGREAAIAGRGALQGAEGLVTMPLDFGTAAVNLGKRVLSKVGLDNDPSYMQLPSQSNDQGLTDWGLPTPSGPGEKTLATAAGVLAGSRIPNPDTPPYVGQQLQAAGKTVIPGQTAGQVTGNTGLQRTEGILSKLPGGAPIRQAIGTQKDNLSAGVQDTVDNLAGGRGTTPFNVGTTIDAGVAKGAKDLKDVGGQLYDNIDSAMKTANVTPIVTQKVLSTLTNLPQGAENLSGVVSDPYLKQLSGALKKDLDANAGFIPYDALKGVLTQLNSRIDWTGLSGNANNGALKQVYLAIRQDLNSTADTYGQGAAVKAANKNWADVKDRMDALNNAVSGNGGPEQIFNRLVSGAKSGPSGLSQVMDVLPESSQKLLAAGVLQRLGKSSADSSAFDADTFFRNWGKIDPDAKTRLFGSLPQEYSKNLDKLVQNAATLKAYANVMPNPSNSAQVGVWALGAERAITELLQGNFKSAVAEGIGIPATVNVTSRALTNPRVVQFLARKTEPSKVLGLSGAAIGASHQSAPAPQSQAQKPLWMQIPGQ